MLNNHRKQLKEESARRSELEGRIKSQMQQMIIHNRTAKNYQQLFSKLADTKNEKVRTDFDGSFIYFDIMLLFFYPGFSFHPFRCLSCWSWRMK